MFQQASKYYEDLHLGQDKSTLVEGLASHYKGVALDLGDRPSEAVKALIRAVEIRRKLAAADPSINSDLGASLIRLGVAYQHAGEYCLTFQARLGCQHPSAWLRWGKDRK